MFGATMRQNVAIHVRAKIVFIPPSAGESQGACAIALIGWKWYIKFSNVKSWFRVQGFPTTCKKIKHLPLKGQKLIDQIASQITRPHKLEINPHLHVGLPSASSRVGQWDRNPPDSPDSWCPANTSRTFSSPGDPKTPQISAATTWPQWELGHQFATSIRLAIVWDSGILAVWIHDCESMRRNVRNKKKTKWSKEAIIGICKGMERTQKRQSSP